MSARRLIGAALGLLVIAQGWALLQDRRVTPPTHPSPALESPAPVAPAALRAEPETAATVPAPLPTTTTTEPVTQPEPIVEATVVLPEPTEPECELALADVSAAVGVPPGWSTVCIDERRSGVLGLTTGTNNTVAVYRNSSAYEYRATWMHELGHAWDIIAIRSDQASARAAREAWLGRAMTGEEWRGWYRAFGEAWAISWACDRGYCGT